MCGCVYLYKNVCDVCVHAREKSELSPLSVHEQYHTIVISLHVYGTCACLEAVLFVTFISSQNFIS